MNERSKKKVLIFDLDNTLYYDKRLLEKYEEVGNKLVWQKRWSPGVNWRNWRIMVGFCLCGRRFLACLRRKFQEKLGYFPPISYVLKEFFVDYDTWRDKRNCISNNFLPMEDIYLQRLLRALSRKYRFAIVTNNTPELTQRILSSIGIHDFFCDETIVCADGEMIKPDKRLWYRLLEKMGIDEPEMCLMVGDRYDIDLKPATKMGMKVVQVESVDDIYRLLRSLVRNDAEISEKPSYIEEYFIRERELCVKHLEHTFSMRDRYVATYLTILVPILGVIAYALQFPNTNGFVKLPLVVFLVLVGLVMGCVVILLLTVSWQARDYYRDKKKMIERFLSGYPEIRVAHELFLKLYNNFSRNKVKRLPHITSTYSFFIGWVTFMNGLLVSCALFVSAKKFDWSEMVIVGVIGLVFISVVFISWGIFWVCRLLLVSKEYLE
jgi:FMN phosphatase YigB (HAD superfamily)